MKKFKHKSTPTVLLILILSLLIGTLAACQSSGMAEKGGDWSLDPVSDDLKLKVENAVREHNGPRSTWTWGDYYYYGRCGDRVLLYYPIPTCEPITIEVAGEVITSPSGMIFYVYANGKIYFLEEAYEQGLLTKENIADIAAYYNDQKNIY